MGGFNGGGGRGGNGNPAVESLRSAITDNMPDAEIKARLDHLREGGILMRVEMCIRDR